MRQRRLKANAVVQCSIMVLPLLLVCGSACAQAPAPPDTLTDGPVHVQSGPVAGFSVAINEKAEVVKGRGYQADAITETLQTLADGSHISHKMVASVARDAEGRTMRTETLDGMGLWGGASERQVKITMVFDPVAGTHLHWQSDSKTATIMPMPRMAGIGTGPARLDTAEAGGVVSGGTFHTEVIAAGPGMPAPGPDTIFIGGTQEHIERPGAASSNETTEQLGNRMVEGIEAVGTRVTQIIPAGTIGNDKDLVSTRESWFSPELKIVVMSIRNDPRFGQIRYTLSNIQVAEPNPSLFQPPAGYTILRPRLPGD